MLDYIASIIVRCLNKVFSLIPISFSLWVARILGRLAFFFNKKRRLVAYANLKAAFAREKSPQELRAITRKVYENLLQTFVEIINLTKVSKRYVDKYVEVVNMERIDNAAKSGRGTILLTAHFGDWELSSLVSATKGYPILVLAREQKMKRLNELLNRLRESKGCKVIRKGMSTKNLLRALYDKSMVGILSDQDAGKNGMFVDFFGRPTSTHSGAMEMAKRTGSIILPNFIMREKGPYHKLFLEEYIDFSKSSGGDDIRENLQKFSKILESYVRRYPEQWLWLHKRWKSTPVKTILILNDGKAGHLNQSLAAAAQIQKARTTQGYRMEDTRIVTVNVKFKNTFLKTALSVCAPFATWRCHGCMRCMKECLEEASYEALMRTYSDFVISCGSSVEAVNVFMGIENAAKNIVIMKPNFFIPIKKFSLAIIPNHDNPPAAKNVVSTTMAPNLISDETLRRDGQRLNDRLHLKKGLVVGLLVGGDNPEFSLTAEAAGLLAGEVLKFCDYHDAQLLVTTSRRTSKEVESVLKSRFKDDPRCRLLVIANESNMEEAVGGMLDLSTLVVVSGESVSMVSEAVSSNKNVVAFELARKGPSATKHERILKRLEANGYLMISKITDLAAVMEKSREGKRAVKELKDRSAIFEAVRRLI